MRSLAKWTATFADTLAAAINELAKVIRREPIELLAIDCQPWHGTACRTASSSEAVRGAIEGLARGKTFRISITHPDDGEER
jgi:hypothetical protein